MASPFVAHREEWDEFVLRIEDFWDRIDTSKYRGTFEERWELFCDDMSNLNYVYCNNLEAIIHVKMVSVETVARVLRKIFPDERVQEGFGEVKVIFE